MNILMSKFMICSCLLIFFGCNKLNNDQSLLKANSDYESATYENGIWTVYCKNGVAPQEYTDIEYSEAIAGDLLCSNLVDFLIVVDNSGSMGEEQAAVSTKLNPLLSEIQDTDWKIAVVTTDPSDSCPLEVITKGDANYETKFTNAINSGTSGSAQERGVLQAVNALSGECGSWLRSGSTLGVLIISDEDNCSNGSGCSTNPWAYGSYLLDHLESIREVGLTARVYGLIWHPSTPKANCPTAYYQANIYADMIDETNGRWGSICDSDYTEFISGVSKDMRIISEKEKVCENWYFSADDVYNDSCTSIIGGLFISDSDSITSLVPLAKLQSIDGDLVIARNSSLESLRGLDNLQSVTNITIDNNLSLSSLDRLDKLEIVSGEILIINNNITNLVGLESLEVARDITITDNLALESLTGLGGLKSVSNFITLLNNPALCDIDSFMTLEGKTLDEIAAVDDEGNCISP